MSTVRIPLRSRKYPNLFAIVDEANADLVGQYKWWPLVRTNGKPAYAQAHVTLADGSKKHVLMHRLLMDFPDSPVDHINGNGFDNRRENLRIVMPQQNSWNTGPHEDAFSRYKGVIEVEAGRKWRAVIKVAGKGVSLGTFESEVEAALAYDAASRRFHGEYGYLNFPDLDVLMKRLLSPDALAAAGAAFYSRTTGENEGLWADLPGYVRSIYEDEARDAIGAAIRVTSGDDSP